MNMCFKIVILFGYVQVHYTKWLTMVFIGLKNTLKEKKKVYFDGFGIIIKFFFFLVGKSLKI